MQRVNPTVVFLVMTALMLVALFVPGPAGGALLLVVAAAAGVLLVGTWQRLAAPGRAIRLLVIGLLLVLAVSRFG